MIEWQVGAEYGSERATLGDLVLNVWPAKVKGGVYGKRATVVRSEGWKASVWRDEGNGSMRRVWDGEGFTGVFKAREAAEAMALAGRM